ncbi:MAG: tetratricopeptide repeat protein [Longimicrobiales bacterium]
MRQVSRKGQDCVMRRSPSRRRAGLRGSRTLGFRWLAGVLFALGLVAAPVEGQAGRERVREGNRLYQEGRFAEAHQKYLEAMAEAPESPIIPFNDGNALYQDADYQRAMEAYQRAIETSDPRLASSAWYNLGNALYRQQQLEESLEAFKQALRLNPQDGDAKHNLERVLEQMQEQQQQQQQQGDDPEDEDEDEEEDDQDQQNPQDQDQDQDQQNRDPSDGEQNEDEQPESPPQGQEPPEGEQPPQQGDMTPEEAERLLDAIEEDPEDVNRKRISARGRRPRKPW